MKIFLSILGLFVLVITSCLCIGMYLGLRNAMHARNPYIPAYEHQMLWETLTLVAFSAIQIAGGCILERLFSGPSIREHAIQVARAFGTEPDLSAIAEDDSWVKLKRLGVYTIVFGVFTVLSMVGAFYFLSNHPVASVIHKF